MDAFEGVPVFTSNIFKAFNLELSDGRNAEDNNAEATHGKSLQQAQPRSGSLGNNKEARYYIMYLEMFFTNAMDIKP
ncbi:hypothetical protein EB796_007529 [Bugula neritina]|uniref:Uncharacterized protein n=1 Tax=Bugula neritina TaxID=10212 RepID=A0A7J7K6C3_BUGNE|nr:hypothetical protein EB796_007529 [Bugula neritina]